jgi:hypothetical protein
LVLVPGCTAEVLSYLLQPSNQDVQPSGGPLPATVPSLPSSIEPFAGPVLATCTGGFDLDIQYNIIKSRNISARVLHFPARTTRSTGATHLVMELETVTEVETVTGVGARRPSSASAPPSFRCCRTGPGRRCFGRRCSSRWCCRRKMMTAFGGFPWPCPRNHVSGTSSRVGRTRAIQRISHICSSWIPLHGSTVHSRRDAPLLPLVVFGLGGLLVGQTHDIAAIPPAHTAQVRGRARHHRTPLPAQLRRRTVTHVLFLRRRGSGLQRQATDESP